MSKHQPRHPRVAIAKIGWCESYTGDPVSGRTAHIIRTGDGHERFNFRTAAGGFYGYVPPSGPEESPPQPATPTGWLIVFVAPRGGHGPLVAVGWYEDAEVERQYQHRPEYVSGARFERDVEGDEYVFAVRASRATPIQADQRSRFPLLSGHRMRRAPWVYCRGERGNDHWREEHALWAESVVAQWGARQAGEQLSPVAGFADPRFAKKVEDAAVAAVCSWLDRDYVITDRQDDPCGYDLLAMPKRKEKDKSCT